MAIARSAGTEIIRSATFNDIDGEVSTKLIIGEQHHIYTVLSITIFCQSVDTAGNAMNIDFVGYDAKGGTSAVTHRLCRYTLINFETFVWNDKFSFNGFEPTNFVGPMDDATKQNAIADQGSSVSQYIKIDSSGAADTCRCQITYIDQNNN